MKSPLSNEFKVACEIYYQDNHTSMCTKSSLLVTFCEEGVDWVEKQLDTLSDWGILKYKYDNSTSFTPLYTISSNTFIDIRRLYKKWWKQERKERGL
jgi:hypothetical protein